MKRLIILTIVLLGLTFLAPVLSPADAKGLTVDIIHKGRLITVSIAALPAHLMHGDTLAETCPGGEVPPCS